MTSLCSSFPSPISILLPDEGKLSSEEVLRRIDTTEKVDVEIIQAVEEKLSELEDYYYFTRELQNQVGTKTSRICHSSLMGMC